MSATRTAMSTSADNAKTQRYAPCNTLETLLVHEAIAPEVLPRLGSIYRMKQVELRADEHGAQLLRACLNDTGLGQAIVFTATKRQAEELSEDLQGEGFAVDALHGDMNQPGKPIPETLKKINLFFGFRHTRVVSRWLVTPMAWMSAASSRDLASGRHLCFLP